METKAFDNICKKLSEMSITDFDLFSKRKVVKNEFYFNMSMPKTSTRELYNELIIPFYEELNDNHKISFVKQTETIILALLLIKMSWYYYYSHERISTLRRETINSE